MRKIYFLTLAFLFLLVGNVQAQSTCTAFAGVAPPDTNLVELQNGSATLTATPSGNAVVPQGYNLVYLLSTDTNGQANRVVQLSSSPSFTVSDTGKYAISPFVYDPDPNSADYFDTALIRTGSNGRRLNQVVNIYTRNNLCASLVLHTGFLIHVVPGTPAVCTADAGTIKAVNSQPTLINGAAQLDGTPQGDAVIPAGYSVLYVLTSGSNLVIEQVSTTPSFSVSATGSYKIHTLIYNADPNSPDFLDLSVVQFGVTTGVDVFNLINSSGICASLDLAGAQFTVTGCTADAGTLTATFSQVSLVGGSASLSATPDGNINVPAGYSVIYVLTSGSGLVIEQVNTTPDFTVSATGDYTIHTLVFNGDSTSPDFLDLSIVQFGTTTGVDVLNLINSNGICASLDVPGAPVSVVDCVADAGTITADFSQVSLVGGSASLSATPDGNINVPTGYSVIYVLTSGSGLVIEQVNTTPDFTVSATGDYTIHTLVYNGDNTSSDFLDLSVVQFGTTTGVDVLNLVTANGICASLDVPGAPISVVNCVADAGTITADFVNVSLVNGSANLSATPDGNINVPAGYSVIYVLTKGGNLVIEQVSTTPDFTVTVDGDYTIHTLVYNADSNSSDFLDLSVVQFGTTTGVDVLNLVTANGICASLDVAGAGIHVAPCTADAGTITADFSQVSLVGGSASLSATPDGNINVPAGYSVIYVLTSGSALVIEQVNTTPDFTVSATGDYTIHTLVFNGDSNSSDFLDLSVVQFGTTTGVDVLNLVTANGICASLDVPGAPISVVNCVADAGTITADFSQVSLVGGSASLSATPDGNINVPAGYSVIYVLTSGSGLVIEQVNTTPDFTVSATGDYTIHTLVFNGDSNSSDFLDLSVVQFGTTTGVDVLNLVTANGICASLDVPGAPISVVNCVADAGTITADFSQVSLVGGSASLSATPDGNINVPAGYSVIYVLTSGSGLVIEQVNTTPDFTVSATGDYTIHTLVFNGDSNSSDFLDLSVVQFGTTTGVDVLNLVTANGICASLDVPGAPISVVNCVADAGTITADFSQVSLVGGSASLSATPDGNINVPTGYSVIYVLTSGSGLVIEQVNTTPDFTVSATGDYTIHTLVFNGDSNSSDFLDLSVVQFGTTTGVDVLNLVTANGICASLDVPGAPISVVNCVADAGTITADFSQVSLVGGSASLSATPDGNINVPTGYSVIYVLTSGSGLVIEQVNTTPDFTVSATGDYTIHTLVFNGDSNSSDFLDLSVVQFGTTTGVDVLNLVTANGICASLDVPGAPISVVNCVADAGTITADFSQVSLVGGSASLSATPDGNINVPAGYSVIYVLTSGSGLVIEQVNTTPDFTVSATGDYTIHTLVFNGDSNSSDFLDLSVVQFGTTTGVDVLNLVTANGICASLDVPGAPISVVNCVADAGTITADFSQVSLVGGSASLSATPDGNINVPAGYSVIYVLTSGSGLVIEQVNTTPDFTVSATGDYTIHTLVFNGDSNSSDFLDLSVVQFGTTTGVDVLNLVTANGICASLDVPGAPISVVNCVADAGTITALNSNSSLLNGQAILTGVPDGNINVPTGYSVIYVLTSGTGLVIEQVNTMPTFAVTDTGLFTIHTLVYNADSNSSDFLDLSIVQFGTTTGVDVLNLVTANGICASLDVPGAPITVFECTADAGTITPDFSSVSLMNGSATLTATPDGNINVPAGYNVLYVLTSDSNLVIQQVDTLPSFTVTAPGLYTIHTLVYNPDTSSLNFLDLSVVVPGVTTGVDVLNLIAANGICADLDAAGAPIDVVGMLRFTFFNVRGDLSSIQPSAKLIWGIEGSEQGGKLGIEKSQDAVVFQNIGNIRVNRTEANEVIFDYNDSNIFGGDTYYRIKYNSVTGGVLYSDLFKFNDAGGLQPVLEAFPNPVVNSLKFTVQNMGTVNYTVTDLSGKVFLQGQVDFDTENEMQLDLSNLSPGVYNLLVRDIESGRSQVAKLIKQ